MNEKKEKWEKENNIKIAIVGYGHKGNTLVQLAMEMYKTQKPKQQEEKDIEK